MHQLLSQRRGRHLVRCFVIGLAVAVSVAIIASPVAAGQPTKTTGAFAGDSAFTGVCSFEVGVHYDVAYTEIDHVDASGALKAYIHNVEQDTFTANGKTLVGIPITFNVEILVDSSGNETHNDVSGLVEKVWLPDGSLFISAGRLDWNNHPTATFVLSPDKGNPGNVAGFCAALAP